MKWGLPHILFWLWTLIPVAFLLLVGVRWREKRLKRLIGSAPASVMMPSHDPRRTRQRILLLVCILGLLITALAQPQWGFHWREVKRQGLDIIIAMDTSNSMLAQDIKPNRLEKMYKNVDKISSEIVRELPSIEMTWDEAFAKAKEDIDGMCKKLLANPVIEDYRFELIKK